MSALTRYPAPRAVAAGKVDGPRLSFRLEPTPVLAIEFLRPFQATKQGIPAGAVDDPRLYFRLEPTIVPAPVLDFLQPLRATKQGIAAGAVDDPRLHFRLEAAVGTNRLLLINPPGLDGGFGMGLSL